ncbi:MAG: hypothetical protein IMW98_08455 [Firmicutes bacterium]|nr:hypothetical protein [Bacillota bacterium]MBE3590836.1 hypothetical protein [Bacillota bacterium]
MGRIRYAYGRERPGKMLKRRYDRSCSDVMVYSLETGELLRIEPNMARKGADRSAHEQRMKEILDKLLPGERKFDNCRPPWLRNPATGYHLELDRYYPDLGIAFEYQGAQHAKRRYHRHAKAFKAQQERDKVKHRIALEHGVVIVYVWRRDLTEERIQRKLAHALKRRARLQEELAQACNT